MIERSSDSVAPLQIHAADPEKILLVKGLFVKNYFTLSHQEIQLIPGKALSGPFPQESQSFRAETAKKKISRGSAQVKKGRRQTAESKSTGWERTGRSCWIGRFYTEGEYPPV